MPKRCGASRLVGRVKTFPPVPAEPWGRPWQEAQLFFAPTFQAASPFATHSMAGFCVSSRCIARVDSPMNSEPDLRASCADAAKVNYVAYSGGGEALVVEQVGAEAADRAAAAGREMRRAAVLDDCEAVAFQEALQLIDERHPAPVLSP